MGWVPQTGATVTDASGTHFVLADQIGEGGQGVVFATQAEGAAVKISTARDASGRREVLERQIADVARMPLADLPVAAPRYPLTGDVVGYTMTMLTGMTSLASLTLELGQTFDENWYVSTGGLRKRLLAVEMLAEVIAALHARGLVYCDLSANNVLVSAAPDRGRLFLIDLDNLRPLDEPPRRIFTPHYAAPEQGTHGATQASDLFSLAVVAFSVLSAANPFYGELLDSQRPEAYQEAPFAAAAPWIDDPGDDRNRWPHALPRLLCVSPLLHRIFTDTFTAGRFDPEDRAPAAHFAIAARRARYAVVECARCGWQSYASRLDCPSCGRQLAGAHLRLYADEGGRTRPHRLCPVVALSEGTHSHEVSAAALGLIDGPSVVGITVSVHGDDVTVGLEHDDLEFQGSKHGGRSRLLPAGSTLTLSRRARCPLILALSPGCDS